MLSELVQALEPEFSLILHMKFVISRVCGQFVVVDSVSDRLLMVHETARHHILNTKSELGVTVSTGHKLLFTRCLTI